MENELNEEILKPKLSIIEPDFILDICEWNPTTLAFLKAFTDHKCSGNKKIDPPVESNDKPLFVPITDIKPENKPDTQFIPDPKETEDDIPIEKEKQDLSTAPEKRPSPKQYKIKDATVLSTHGTNKYKVYKPIYEHIKDHLPDSKFTRDDIINLLLDAYDEVFNEELALSSARTYYTAYKKYMIDNGIIEETCQGIFSKIKENSNTQKE